MFNLQKLYLVPAMAGLILCSSVCYGVPVTWNTSAGGNGHQYEYINNGSALTWYQAKANAEARGGYLATITSAAEMGFVYSNFSFAFGAITTWIGGYQDKTDNNSPEPAGGWKWVTGEPFVYTAWNAGEPNNWPHAGGEDHMVVYGNYWADVPYYWGTVGSYIMEIGGVGSAIPEPSTILLFGLSLSWMVKRVSFFRKK